MNRIEELKQHNPYYGKSLIDILSYVLEKPKYVEMAIRMTKDKQSKQNYYIDVKDTLTRQFGMSQEKVNALARYEVDFIFTALENVGRENVYNLIKFADYNERKLIDRNDVSQYSSFADLENQLSLAELKLIDKELQKQTSILLEDKEWLVLKPLSFEASLKYGASTRWCTAMKNDPEYFARYAKRGIVIYCINKLTGHKIAAFKNLNQDYDRETSFWNAQDARIDSMETDLPSNILDIIRFEFATAKLTNWELIPQEARSRFEPQLKSYLTEDAPALQNERNLVSAIQNLGREEIYHGEVQAQEELYYGDVQEERPQLVRG
jgi:hypothetical protein